MQYTRPEKWKPEIISGKILRKSRHLHRVQFECSDFVFRDGTDPAIIE